MDPVRHCDHLVGEEGSGCFVFLGSVTCVLTVFFIFYFFFIFFGVIVTMIGLTTSILFFISKIPHAQFEFITKTRLFKYRENFTSKN